MKRIEQLHSLSKEHHLSLVLASKSIKVAKNASAEEIKQLCREISSDFDKRWEAHFAKEELSIFTVFEDKYQSQLIVDANEDAELTELLRKQHDQMRSMSAEMAGGRIDQLAEFGCLLRDHTRLEERRLFPLISELFDKQELDFVASTTRD